MNGDSALAKVKEMIDSIVERASDIYVSEGRKSVTLDNAGIGRVKQFLRDRIAEME